MKAVIFDLYGVLALNGWQAFKAKHFSDHVDLWDEVFELGRKVDAGMADYNELISFTAEKTGESEAAVRYQLEHTLANQELLDYIRTDLKPYYELGILSNASSSKVIDQVFSMKDEALFDAIVLSSHTGLVKPNTEMYRAIASRLGVAEADCLYFDDQERHVEGARAAGMQGFVFTDVAKLKETIKALS